MGQTGKHQAETTAGAMLLSSSFLRDAARATHLGNDQQLLNICEYNNVELTPEVESKINQKIEDSRRTHHVQQRAASAQQQDGDPTKYFLFALGSLVLLLGGLAAGYFFFFAPIGMIYFLVQGFSAMDHSSAPEPFSHKNIV